MYKRQYTYFYSLYVGVLSYSNADAVLTSRDKNEKCNIEELSAKYLFDDWTTKNFSRLKYTGEASQNKIKFIPQSRGLMCVRYDHTLVQDDRTRLCRSPACQSRSFICISTLESEECRPVQATTALMHDLRTGIDCRMSNSVNSRCLLPTRSIIVLVTQWRRQHLCVWRVHCVVLYVTVEGRRHIIHRKNELHVEVEVAVKT